MRSLTGKVSESKNGAEKKEIRLYLGSDYLNRQDFRENKIVFPI